MYGITDPVTGIHHMYGKDLRFIRPNYSGTLLYVFLGPTCRPGDIEYACLWNEVWPTSPDGKGKFVSGEIGNDSAIDAQSVTLSGIFQDGPEVNILAKYIVASTGLAGQSYFNQMLPAYMYDKYINKLGASKPDDEGTGIRAHMNMTVDGKLATLNDKSVYTQDILTKRENVTKQYGVDTSAVSGESNPGSVTSMFGDITGGSALKVDNFEPKVSKE